MIIYKYEILATKSVFLFCFDQRKDVYAYFTDYEKAFDRVRHDELIEILRKRGANDTIYESSKCIQEAISSNHRPSEDESEDIRIYRGVRQEFVLPLLVFNVYVDKLFKEALEKFEKEVKINE